MSRLLDGWNAWVAAWTATERGTSFAMFRFFVGLIVLVDMVLILPHIDPLYVPVTEGGLGHHYSTFEPLLWLGGLSGELAFQLHYAAMFFAFLVTIGLGGRISAFVLLQLLLIIHEFPQDIGGGYDRLIYNGLFLLVLGNGTATLSVDSKLWNGTWRSDVQILALPRYLAIYQTIILYVATGFAKGGSTWHYPYHAVFRAFTRTPYGRWDEWQTGIAIDLYQFSRLGTAVAWWWEVTFVVLIVWFVACDGWLGDRLTGLAQRFDLRIPYLGIGLWTHFLLWVLLDLGWFTGITFAFYITLYRPDEWEEVLPWTRARPPLAVPSAPATPADAVPAPS